MTKRHTRTKRRSSKHSLLIPMTFMVTSRMKASLEKRAKETGFSVSKVGSLLLDFEEMEKTIESMVRKKLDRIFEPILSLMENRVSKIDQIDRILRRILNNPSEDIDTIVREEEEKEIN